jgi:hypothetical protein
MGVWQWDSGSDAHYQSVFPVEAWHHLTDQSTPGNRSARIRPTVGVPISARPVQSRGLDPVTLTPSYLAHLSKQELEVVQLKLNSQKSGLRELVTAELVRRYQVDESHKPSSVRTTMLEPVCTASVDMYSKSPQTVPTVEVKIEVAVTATRAQTQKATTCDGVSGRLPTAESRTKKRAWWQFWIPKA